MSETAIRQLPEQGADLPDQATSQVRLGTRCHAHGRRGIIRTSFT